MNYTEQLTKYIGHFIDELAHKGVKHAVISPGSRSTPLAMTVTEHKDIKEWVLVDERSASFFALGLARATSEPVVLICTSGTAAANYYPAIIEAYEQRTPLIILTADRPHELRDIGASQTINQIGMYGNFVKWFHEMALPEATDSMLKYAKAKAARAVIEAKAYGNDGPVHLNFPLREPLVPDFSLDDIWGERLPTIHHESGHKILSDEQLEEIAHTLEGLDKGVIVCGPQDNEDFGQSIVQLAEKLNIPIIADPLSQVRAFAHEKTHIIEGYDAFLFSDKLKKELQADYIIRFGAMPISKRYLQYVTANPPSLQIVVESEAGVREPTNEATHLIYANKEQFVSQLSEKIKEKTHNAWLKKWHHYNAIVKKHLQENDDQLTEGRAVQILFSEVPDDSGVFVGNSMPVRDTDTFFLASNDRIKLYGNRGVSGIEGINSTVLGIAAAKKHTHHTLVIGDLSFYHDINGLFASQKYNIPLTVLLLNNDGGGIFSFLPQAKEGRHFETLFGTPMGIDFKHVANLYKAQYECVQTEDDLKKALQTSYKHEGLSIIEVQTDRDENAKWHRNIWQKIQEEL